MPIEVVKQLEADQKRRRGNEDRTFIYVHRHRKLISRKKDNCVGERRNGIWTLAETRRYIEFLRGHVDEFRDKQSRRNQKIFVFMAKIIKTRSPIQCRSHHQKMINRHGTIWNVIDHYELKAIPAYLYKNRMLRMSKSELDCRKKFYTIKIVKNEIKISIK